MISLRKKKQLLHRRTGKLIKYITFFLEGLWSFFPLNSKPVACTCNTGSELKLGGRSKTNKKVYSLYFYLCNINKTNPPPLLFLKFSKTSFRISVLQYFDYYRWHCSSPVFMIGELQISSYTCNKLRSKSYLFS